MGKYRDAFLEAANFTAYTAIRQGVDGRCEYIAGVGGPVLDVAKDQSIAHDPAAAPDNTP